uniref:Uncharacterized protein n=1 Tax=Panagrellus redivivus TaxID=6233 RepID=A0A7E5A164_PANRE
MSHSLTSHADIASFVPLQNVNHDDSHRFRPLSQQRSLIRPSHRTLAVAETSAFCDKVITSLAFPPS